MSSQSHLPHCRVWEFHPAYWKSFSPYFISVLFSTRFRLWRAAAFVSSLIHLTIGHRHVFLVFHHTYLLQLLNLGKLSRPKCHAFSLKLLIFWMLQYLDINCKTVTILFLLIIQLTVYNRTITRFIADDGVYRRVRQEMRLASDSSWARHHLKHLSWRSRFNHHVHTWTENSSFMRNLTSWSVPYRNRDGQKWNYIDQRMTNFC